MSPASTLDLAYPFRGNWRVQNSPANRVPSHGTRLFATSFAIDFVPVTDSGRTAPFTFRSLMSTEPPERFPGFGRPIYSPVTGIIASTHDGLTDHPAYRGLASIGYALSQRKRMQAGWRSLAGNYIAIDIGTAIVYLCHLREGSITVKPGQRIHVGELLAECGNSGNSTEPHLHLQATDSIRIEHANPVPISFQGSLPKNGQVLEISPND